MTIASEITRLAQAKADIKDAIEDKGVTVGASATLDEYAEKILAIQTGGGSVTPAGGGGGILFTGATYPVTFKGNTNIYENEYIYKGLGYDITITGLGAVATITGNGTQNVKVAFDVTGSTDTITPFVITLEGGDEEYNFDCRYFYYGATVAANKCLAVCSLIAPAVGVTGNFTDNFAFVEASAYPLFSANTTAWNTFYSHQVIAFIFAKMTANVGGDFLRYCYAFNQPLTLPSTVTSIGNNFLRYCYAFNQPLTLPDNVNFKTIGNNFLQYCYAFNQPLTIPSTVTSIGTYFLGYCYAFNQPLTLPDNVNFKTIGTYFLGYCYAFNQPLTIPSTVTSIGTYFLQYCYAFNQPLTIPSTVTSIGAYFMNTCTSFTLLGYNTSVYPTDNNSLAQTADTKTSATGTGIKVTGTNAAGLKAALPDRTATPFRKLV